MRNHSRILAFHGRSRTGDPLEGPSRIGDQSRMAYGPRAVGRLRD